MTWIEAITLLVAGFAGLVLGGIFFGGLWWTVRSGLAERNGFAAKQPGLWFLGSMLVRMAIVMLGFYVVSGGQWQRLLSCLVGFVVARAIVLGWTRPPHPNPLPRGTGGEGAETGRLRGESRRAT